VSVPQPDISMEAAMRRLKRDHAAAMKRLATMAPDERAREWLSTVPEYDAQGVVVERFTVGESEASLSKLRAAFNPQRGDRSVEPGAYTRMLIDGDVWMSDTPAEVRDMYEVDEHLADARSALIVGLGLGCIVQRAIVAHGVPRIDVVEREWRVIDAVAPHYDALAKAHGVILNVHRADIHEWRAHRDRSWSVGWLDIWQHINSDDMAEVARLRKRFRQRCGWLGAWAQDERVAQARRTRSGRWAY
jgi:hypothetical protein